MYDGKIVGVIGAGNMAEALISGVIKAGLVAADNIIACDVSLERREVFAGMGCKVTANVDELLVADIVLLGVKPQVVSSVLAEIGARFTADQLLISIAAGVTIETLQSLAPAVRVIRVMPNTPMLVGAGVSGVARGNSAKSSDVAMALEMCASAGDAYEVAESQLDAVTGLSGSGPAYLFYFTECLIEAGIHVGLPPELAEKMACKTVIGAAKLMAQSGESPKALRKKVTSPNGTTEAAIKVKHEKGFAKVVINAVERAKERSEELARGE